MGIYTMKGEVMLILPALENEDMYRRVKKLVPGFLQSWETLGGYVENVTKGGEWRLKRWDENMH